jgi:hypothetical protein
MRVQQSHYTLSLDNGGGSGLGYTLHALDTTGSPLRLIGPFKFCVRTTLSAIGGSLNAVLNFTIPIQRL